LIAGVTTNTAIPAEVAAKATAQLENGVPFVSDPEPEQALKTTDLTPPAQRAAVAENASARLTGLAGLAPTPPVTTVPSLVRHENGLAAPGSGTESDRRWSGGHQSGKGPPGQSR
jgi:hypothetical protein